MDLVDVDVIASTKTWVPGKIDLKLNTFLTELKKQQSLAKVFGAENKILISDVVNVYDMVNRIDSTIGSRRIRRLRLFGHGSENTVLMGPLFMTGRRLEDMWRRQTTRIDEADLDKVIRAITVETRAPDGRLVKVDRNLLNELSLKKLKGRFDTKGWVELQSCKVADKDGKQLIDTLAQLWQVEVHASDVNQVVGGGLEGQVWIAKPGKAPFRKVLPPLAPFGVRTSTQSFQARYDPLREAVGRLQARPAAVSPMPPGTIYSDIYKRKTYEVDLFGRDMQIGSRQGLATQWVSPTTQSFQARYDPLREAVRKLGG